MTCDASSDKPSGTSCEPLRFRSMFSQFLATSVKNMLVMDLGLCTTFAGIIIPALTGHPNNHNMGETLSLTPDQASWLGSVGLIIEPIGSLVSALVTDPLGRRRAMMIVNIPLILAWFLLYTASSVFQIFIANIVLGFGVGLMESPIITYLGEICEPSFRGIMIGYSNICVTLGIFVIFLLNTLLPWRMVALTCMFVPILSLIALFFIPESPIWLLNHDKTAEAEKALCWLRGWVTKDAISVEFEELTNYSIRARSCTACVKQNQKCSHPKPTFSEKLVELKRKQTMKPFCLVMLLFFIAAFSGIFSMAPFIVQIFEAYEIPIAPDQAAAYLAFGNNVGNFVFLCLISITGKRPLYLTTLTAVFLCSAVVCVYGFFVLPHGFNSFDHAIQFSLANKNLSYIPLVSIILWSFFFYCGINSMPWQMLSEVFPYKTRGFSAGLAASLNYVIGFVATKSYYNLEATFSLPGFALFTCIIVGIGIILLFKILPETEGRSLEDIELHFSDNTKKLTDRHIAKRISNKSDLQINVIGNDNASNGLNSHCNRGFD